MYRNYPHNARTSFFLQATSHRNDSLSIGPLRVTLSVGVEQRDVELAAMLPRMLLLRFDVAFSTP